MTYRIWLGADSRNRDLLPMVAIKRAIEKRLPDSLVLAGSYDIWSDIVHSFRPSLVVLSHVFGRRNRQLIADHIRRNNGLVVVLPTEGRPTTEASWKWSTSLFDSALVDLYLAWSDKFAHSLLENYPTMNVKVVGFPRSELEWGLDEPEFIRETLGIKDEFAVTVASSFPSAKFATSATAFHKNDWEDLGLTKLPEFQDPVGIAKKEAEAQSEFKQMLLAYMLRHPEYQYVIRPHPAEDVRYWQDFAQSMPEFKIVLSLDGPINNLFRISNLHISRVGCTTQMEAILAGVSTLVFVTSKDEWQAGAMRASVDLSDTFGYNDVLAGDRFLTPTYAENPLAVVEEWLGPLTGAVDRISNAIVELLEERKPEVQAPNYTEWMTLHQAITKHDQERTSPITDIYGQTGKAVTRSLVYEAESRLP